ncbi:MAG: SDR family NAD(P)-dependent oxidoreductase [Alphaproteobacteria bacterium]|nr:SDR family NAD(P)-dependent oxidoreductase [Alphaproteobacteria bacterium]
MLTLEKMQGNWALVTGASSGIGAEFCQQFAKLGINLVMVSRNAEKINALSARLEAINKIKTIVISVDLSDPMSADKIYQEVERRNVRIRMLINNAALCYAGQFDGETNEFYSKMINVNCLTPIVLSKCLLPHLKSFEDSLILNVSSGAAYQPVPYLGIYAASKSFIHMASQALYGELREEGIMVKTFIPAPTNTSIASNKAYSGKLEKVEITVSKALKILENDDPMLMTAKNVWLQKLFVAFLPAKKLIMEAGKMFKPNRN